MNKDKSVLDTKKKKKKRKLSDNLPSNPNFANIKFIEEDNNVVIQGDFSYYRLPFYKTRSDFLDHTQFAKFIKAVEKVVRQSEYYSQYIGFLKAEVGLNHCMIMPKIDDELADIEMHHGPILTLFDYCAIITDAKLARGDKISTFIIAEEVLREHYRNNVQVVMLCKTAHELFHTGKIFIHPAQAWGDVNGFLDEWADGLNREQIETINEYVDLTEKNIKSTDSGFLEYTGIKSWNLSNTAMLDESELSEGDK